MNSSMNKNSSSWRTVVDNRREASGLSCPTDPESELSARNRAPRSTGKHGWGVRQAGVAGDMWHGSLQYISSFGEPYYYSNIPWNMGWIKYGYARAVLHLLTTSTSLTYGKQALTPRHECRAWTHMERSASQGVIGSSGAPDRCCHKPVDKLLTGRKKKQVG